MCVEEEVREGGKEEERRGGGRGRVGGRSSSATFLPCACKLYIGGVAHKVTRRTAIKSRSGRVMWMRRGCGMQV